MKGRKKTRSGTARPARLGTAVGALVCGVLGVLLICNLAILVQSAFSREKPPSILGVTPMVVLSGSMSGQQEGHIEVGDLVFARRVDPQSLQVGDVISYMADGSAVTHRITSISTGEDGLLQFTTKGDANNAEDTQPVSQEQLIGRFAGRLPRVGDFALFLQQPLGMLLFVGVPLAGCLAYDAISRRRAARETEQELSRLRALAGVGGQGPALPDRQDRKNTVG